MKKVQTNLLALLLVLVLGHAYNCSPGTVQCKCPDLDHQPPRQPALTFSELFGSVVQIKVKTEQKTKQTKLYQSYEYGTGFFIDSRGTILTSAHIYKNNFDPKNIAVLYAGRPLQARVLKMNRQHDLMILSVDATQTTPLSLADKMPNLGDPVFAIGFPYADIFRDAQPTVASGHLAGVDRAIDFDGLQVKNLLVTDAFVADGCSGGPLVDKNGAVVGVLRFNLAKNGVWLGLSFAEPISSYLQLQGSPK